MYGNHALNHQLKFKSANTAEIALLGTTTKFNYHQYFWLYVYGIKQQSGEFIHVGIATVGGYCCSDLLDITFKQNS